MKTERSWQRNDPVLEIYLNIGRDEVMMRIGLVGSDMFYIHSYIL